MCNKYIPMDALIVGRKYECDARNFTVGVWNGINFDYLRFKFGDHYWDQEFHYDDGGTVKPIRIVNEL